MRDEERIRLDIEKPRKPEPIHAAGECELCGNWDTHLVDWICPVCMTKFKLEPAK